MAPGMNVNVAKQAELLKQEGNTYFKKERLGAAIEAYTQAITLCPNVTAYWTNRALCHRKRHDWEKVEADCRKAIELDTGSVKLSVIQEYKFLLEATDVGNIFRRGMRMDAYYMLGLALLQHKKYAAGVKQLQKALDLGRGANPSSYMVEEIWQELAKARYLLWESASSVRLKKQQELRAICERALQRELESTAIQRSQSSIPATLTAGCPNRSRKNTNDGDIESINLEGESISHQNSSNLDLETVYKEQFEVLSDVFNKAAEADTPTEVPEYLCCQITLDIFRDPVITPSGVTYERAVLLEHIQKVGKFDPITREPLQASQLVPNFAIKEAVQAYLDKHGWAYKTTLS